MAKAIIIKCGSNGDYCEKTTFKVEGKESFAREMCERFLKEQEENQNIIITGATVKVGDIPQENPEVKEEVVAIYDNEGIPSFMYRFTKKKNSELFQGGKEKVHPAFIIGGKEYDEIFISVYPNCEIKGKPYSLPFMNPWTEITNDEAARVCFSKGEGWHLMTRAEWGLIANVCAMSGTFPHGNTNYGKYHADGEEYGEKIGDSGKTLTGSGPATWTHNHKPDGIHDLCGNVWEMVRGLRIKDGVLQIAKDNDAAMDIDLTREGDCWQNVVDDEGNTVYVSVDDGEITITTNRNFERGYTGDEWGNVTVDCDSEQLKELALYPGEEKAFFYVDSTSGEYLPICGGYWNYTSLAVVFYVDLNNTRAYSLSVIGFRSAFYRKQSAE